jgi:proline iminopeptidase
MENQTRILTLNNGYHLWTRTEGIGNPIKMITVHGGPGETNESFERFGEFLNPIGIEVTRYDQLGSFYSDQPDFENNPDLAKKYLNIDYFVSELEEIRSQLGYEKFILVGNSWGGMIAQEYALKYQEHLSGLVIVGMTSNDEDYGVALAKVRDQILTAEESKYVVSELDKKNYSDNHLNELLGKMFGTYFYQYDVPRVKHLTETANRAVDSYLLGNDPFKTFGIMAGWNLENKVQNIKVPTYLSFGEQDLFPKEKMELIHHNIPNSELNITPGGTHVQMREFPEYFFNGLIDWINRTQKNEL